MQTFTFRVFPTQRCHLVTVCSYDAESAKAELWRQCPAGLGLDVDNAQLVSSIQLEVGNTYVSRDHKWVGKVTKKLSGVTSYDFEVEVSPSSVAVANTACSPFELYYRSNGRYSLENHFDSEFDLVRELQQP